MPSVRFKMIGGLAGAIGRSGPEYVQDSVNWFAHAGTLKKRKGMTPFRAVNAQETTSGVYVGWTGTASDPGSVTASGSLPLATPGNAGLQMSVFIGHTTAFNRFKIAGVPVDDKSTMVHLGALTSYPLTNGCIFYYWNGSAYTRFYPGNAFFGGYNTTNDTSNIAPFTAYSGSDTGTAMAAGTQFECMFEPPSDWAAKTIGGQSKYWVKVTLPVEPYSSETITSASVCTTENRVLNVLTWQDREETPHDLIVSMKGDTGVEMVFTLDGVALTQSASLQPDGAARVFSADDKVMTVYHSASDRVIGFIQNYGWFYLIPGDGNVYGLPADSVGTDSAYASVFGGLRSALPYAEHMVVAEGRVFAAQGQTLMWSVPGPRPDIWPNASQMYFDDGLGPITGMATVAGSLIVFKRRAIYAVQFNGQDIGSAQSDFDAVAISNNIGAIGGICPAGDTLFFVGEDGFYQFDGKKAVRLTTKFDEEFLAGEIGMDFSKTKAAYYSPLGQVRFFFPYESSNILDRAVYISAASAIIPGDDDDTETPFSIWPQGRVSATQPGEYGFQGTAVCADFSGPPRILLGDRYGFVWEMDSGYGDAGYQVVAQAYQSDQNYAGNSKLLVGPVYVSQNGQVTQNALSVGVIPNGQTNEKKLVAAYPYERGMSRAYTIYALPTATAKSSQPGVTKRLNHNVRCHSFALYVLDNSVGVRDITGFSVEVIPVGTKGF